jgi:NAD(P)H-hydrate repair Nnr-like enzyme with NAD(P)H-hydrate dehydratase domain
MAAIAAAFVHAQSAERWSEKCGADRGLVAHEIADGIPEVLALLSGRAASMPD